MLFLSLSIFMLVSCKGDTTVSTIGFKSPEQGKTYSLGDDVKLVLDIPKEVEVTSATYLVDGKTVGTQNAGKPFVLKTNGLSVGYKIITAIVAHDAQTDTATINIVLNANIKPAVYGYKVVNTYPHDTTSYTEGLEYHDGKFLESTGQEGASTLRWVDLQTGKAVKKAVIESQYFGEGSTVVGDRIIMLTYKTNLGFVYDAKTLTQLSTFSYTPREGWGLCFDGKHLITSDGTNRLYFMNKDTYKDETAIDVYDNKGAVQSINELEYIDGKIYANVYQQNYLIVIDPMSGIVEKKIDLSGIFDTDRYFKDENAKGNNVLNGIAWDAKGRRLFVTGKKWPKLYEIALVPKK